MNEFGRAFGIGPSTEITAIIRSINSTDSKRKTDMPGIQFLGTPTGIPRKANGQLMGLITNRCFAGCCAAARQGECAGGEFLAGLECTA
jgi:hypothetical protein